MLFSLYCSLCRINVKQIILLSRPKKGKTVQQRCDELFGSVVFMNLKKDYPAFIDRIKVCYDLECDR